MVWFDIFLGQAGPRIFHKFSLHYQKGQALVYGLFIMAAGAAGTFFFFNTGQLYHEKSRLVNTADMVAYSAGVMNARALNFQAYTNRAMIANTVAIAQLVSLSSWIQYVDNLGMYGRSVLKPKFIAFYPSYFLAAGIGPPLQAGLNDSGVLQGLENAADASVAMLAGAQSVAYAGLVPVRQQVMSEVASANYRNDGSVSVDMLPDSVTEWGDFLKHYSGDERARFAEAVKTAANEDAFVSRRSWSMPGLWPDCAVAFPRLDRLDRRGGTELIGYDEWKSVDTLSVKEWVPKSKHDPLCRKLAETPAGWGAAGAADRPSSYVGPQQFDGALRVNPASTALASYSSRAWNYSGLPGFYDLSDAVLRDADPRMRMAVRLKRHKNQTATSEGRSQIGTSAHLNDYRASPAGGDEFVAVSTSEVYFERPADFSENVFGKASGKPRELASLFNPYWQTRLVYSEAHVRAARALQGVVAP